MIIIHKKFGNFLNVLYVVNKKEKNVALFHWRDKKKISRFEIVFAIFYLHYFTESEKRRSKIVIL